MLQFDEAKVKIHTGVNLKRVGSQIYKFASDEKLLTFLTAQRNHMEDLYAGDCELFIPTTLADGGYFMASYMQSPDLAVAFQPFIIRELEKTWIREVPRREFDDVYIRGLLAEYHPSLLKLYYLFTKRWPGLFQDKDLIHGDPTYENTVFRSADNTMGWQPKLLDALPTDERFPRSRYLDIGKMIQSALGWEIYKYDSELYDYDQVDCIEKIKRSVDKEEFMVSLFWAAVHYTRIEKRAKADLNTDMQEFCQRQIYWIRLMLLMKGE